MAEEFDVEELRRIIHKRCKRLKTPKTIRNTEFGRGEKEEFK